MPLAEAEADLDEFNRNLPHTVTLLNGPHGALVYVVGTGHFSVESQNDVSKVTHNFYISSTLFILLLLTSELSSFRSCRL